MSWFPFPIPKPSRHIAVVAPFLAGVVFDRYILSPRGGRVRLAKGQLKEIENTVKRAVRDSFRGAVAGVVRVSGERVGDFIHGKDVPADLSPEELEAYLKERKARAEREEP